MATKLTPDKVLEAVERLMSPHWRWGLNDCCTGSSDVFGALWGIDPMKPLRGQYSTGAEAMRLIRLWGGWLPMGSALADAAGLKSGLGGSGEIGVSPKGACRHGGRALMICVQPGAWAAKTATGFAILPAAERSWRA